VSEDQIVSEPAAIKPAVRFIGFDLETTGVDPFTDVPVSFGFALRVVRADGSVESRLKEGYINPGRPIPPGATDIHGITDEMVVGATELSPAVELIARRLSEYWANGDVIVGMNVSYDLTMIDSLCQRLGLPTLAQRGEIGAVADVRVLDQHYDKWRKGKRALGDLCEHYGVSLSNAHSAVYDAEASLIVLEAIRARYSAFDQIPVSDMSATLREWYQEKLANFSEYLVKKGDAPVGAGSYAWPVHVANPASLTQ
jgi:DNA polymerase-3 subunit epsilon